MPTAAEIRAENRRRNEELRRQFEEQQSASGRARIRNNVVTGATPGGFRTPAQSQEELRISAAVGGRIGGFTGDPHPETTRLDSLSQSFGAQSFRGISITWRGIRTR